jgi:hypothetical protein
MLKLFSSLLLCLIFFCPPISALTIGVPNSKSTIQAGIEAASPGDTVLVQPGTYYETIDFKGKNIVVGSMFLTTRDTSYISSTIIDAQRKNTVVIFQSGETSTEFCGFTITNGQSHGIWIDNPHPNPGGGIYCKNASPYLHHLIVENSQSQYDGGGMYLEKSNSVIENCVIRNNRAVGSGGGLFFENGNHQITNCIINNNSGNGGGILCAYSTIRVYKVLMSLNSNDAFQIHDSDVNIINCTITNQGSYAFQIFYSDVNIVNSIFWNSSPQIRIIRDNAHPELPISHITVAFSDIKGGKDQIKAVSDSLYYENNNIDADPLLKNISNGDYTLSIGSPCIDKGIAFYKIGDALLINLKKEDYNGSTPDMGCYESNYASTIVNENNTYNLSLSNFPNPFNSTTIIHFSLSKPSHVRLAIFTITGQKCNVSAASGILN